MNYQVWTKHDYDEAYEKVECGDIEAVKRELEKSLRKGDEPLVTVEVPYTMNIKVMEVGSEAPKGKTKPDKVARGEGDREVRRGDKAATEELDKGSGDSSTGNSAGD